MTLYKFCLHIGLYCAAPVSQESNERSLYIVYTVELIAEHIAIA